jgi:predicted GNAT family acetyltransferase
MTKSDLITTREFVKDDEALIYATWLRGLYHSNTWYNLIEKNVFMENYHRVIEHILYNENTKITISCLKDSPSTILGYSVTTKDDLTIHFIFVKTAWRKIGIAKDLITNKLQNATHFTKVGLVLINKLGLRFNPFLI